MPAPRMLQVWPNPFFHVDHEGRPAGLVHYEPKGSQNNPIDSRRFVGATLKVTITKAATRTTPSEQENEATYADEATTVEDSDYYRAAIRERHLLPADEKTAKRVGAKFVDPAKELLRLRAEMVEHMESVHAHDDHEEDFLDGFRAFAFGPMPKPKSPEKPSEAKTDPPGDPVGSKTTAKGGK